MKNSILYAALLAVWALISLSASFAEEVSIPNTFQSGATAVASEVNANFTAVKTAVDDNDDRIAELEALVSALQARIEELEESNVMALDPYVSVDEDSDDRGPLVQLSGVNLQVVNGLGSTETINGLGNIIVGYDEQNQFIYNPRCSNGNYDNQTECEDNGGTWSYSFKFGSHYLVLGSENSYSQYGGMVAGFRGFSRGEYSSVVGGFANDSCGSCSTVSGGHANIASGSRSSISGGYSNEASNFASSISGGEDNTASGHISSISGGEDNTASGDTSSISGGDEVDVSGENDWAAGSLFQDD